MKNLLVILATILAFCGHASAIAAEAVNKAPKAKVERKATPSTEEMILASINKKFPATQVTSITKAPMGDLYEVVMGKNIAYVDADTNYFLFGHIFDMTNQHDLTQDRVEALNKVDFSKLPLDKAIKVVKGNGKRVFAVFTDPECPYCMQLEQSVSEVDNYTMYVFLYPIAELHPSARSKSAAIWCSADRAKAFHQVLTENADLSVALAGCKGDPLDEIAALGKSLGVQGTPTLIHKDGRRAPGAMPAPALDNWLNGPIQAGKAVPQPIKK